ncbi:hypothetical protein [Tenacibaculum sp.]|uniref:hypothetical protein n=1 Tax=Tenacibaculum sp. TaxID=1906242 RepID=UPI003AA995F4
MAEDNTEQPNQNAGQFNQGAENNTTQQTAKLFSEGGRLTTKEQRKGKRESVRSYIALSFIIGFFIVIFFGLGIGAYNYFDTKEYKDMLIAISGILSGPLGFIIGFYFKGSTDE